MKTTKFRITVSGEEVDGSIRLNDLVDQLNAIRSTLTQVDHAVSGSKSANLYYRVTHITMNSPATFMVEAVPREGAAASIGRKVVSRFTRDLKSVISGKRPKDASLELLEAYAALAKPMRGHVAQVALHFEDQDVDLPRNLDIKVDAILGPDHVETGAIVGSLDVIDVHGPRNLFRIYPRVGPVSVKCIFSREMLPQAVAAINRAARISGQFHYKRAERFPHLIKVSSIEVLPEKGDAPTLASLKGLAKGALGELTSEQFVERVRSGGW